MYDGSRPQGPSEIYSLTGNLYSDPKSEQGGAILKKYDKINILTNNAHADTREISHAFNGNGRTLMRKNCFW
jgi:hypothetical protein